MFHKLLTEIRPSEGTMIIYDNDSQKFEMAYEYLYGDTMLTFGDKDVRDNITGWFLSIEEFFEVTEEVDRIENYSIYWMDA